MTDFHQETAVKRTRKDHRCRQCGTSIAPYSEAVRAAGQTYGDFYHYYLHPDCSVAGNAYAEATGLWGEDYVFFSDEDLARFDLDWLQKHHPSVYHRLTGATE